MDNTSYQEFFARPTHPYHRRYEALRAVFLDGRSQKDAAELFGYRYSTLRQLVYEFRRQARDSADATPFFETRSAADRPLRASRRRRG
jgi:transposase